MGLGDSCGGGSSTDFHDRNVAFSHDLGSVESVDSEEMPAHRWLDWDGVAWDVGSLNALFGFAWLADGEAESQSSGS